jgi:hypothetical protein
MIDTSLPQSEPVVLPARPFGRVARSVVAHGVATALMAASPLLVFVPAAIFHCGARNGRRAVWIALAIAIAIFAGQTAIVAAKPENADGAWMFFTGVMLAIALPAALAFPFVERGMKFGRTLIVLLAGAGIGLGATELILRQVRSFSAYALSVASAQKTMAPLLQLYRDNKMPSLLIRVVELLSDPRVQSAIALIDITLVFVLSLLMIGRLRAWRDSVAVRVGPEALSAYLFRNFALPEWLLFAFLFGGLTPITAGLLQTVAANVLMVVTFLYMLQGLAIYRALLIAMGVGVGGTILGWMLMAFALASGIGWLLLAIAGLFDPFFDFRHFKRKDDSHESHTD